MHVVFTKTSAGEDWVCKKAGKPICNELFTKQPYLSSTMYHPEELASYCAARIAFPVKIAQVKLTLQPVLRLHKDVSGSWWSRMRKLVEQARLGGPPEQFLTELPALLQALRDKGWKADMITMEPSVMKWRLGLAWKAKYDKDKKRDPNIGPYDPSTAPAVDSNRKYVLAVHLQPPWASSYMDVLDPVVSNSDFTFMHFRTGGPLQINHTTPEHRNGTRTAGPLRAIVGLSCIGWGHSQARWELTVAPHTQQQQRVIRFDFRWRTLGYRISQCHAQTNK